MLTWSWLGAPYFACAIAVAAVAIAAAALRGDRILRLAVIGAATTTFPWALCSGMAACASDAETATRLLRIGQGPVALVGPNLLLLLFGVSGRLERHRWIARIAAAFGSTLLAVCWLTDLIVPGARRLESGLWYLTSGPLTDLHVSQLTIWLGLGLFLVRGTSTAGERRRLIRMLVFVLGLGATGAVDMLVVHGVWDSYPVAWLPVTVVAILAFYMVTRTKLLRPRGIDDHAVLEALGFGAAAVVISVLASTMAASDHVPFVILSATAWGVCLGVAWTVADRRPIVPAMEALERFGGALADVDDDAIIVQQLAELWRARGPSVVIRRVWRHRDGALSAVGSPATRSLPSDVGRWLVEHELPLSAGELETMYLGGLRPGLEALVHARGVTVIVPLVDRAELVGLVEADAGDALRDADRALLHESAKMAARALTYAALAREATRQGELAREVEIAEAMRRHAGRSVVDDGGPWRVLVEYRPAPRSAGAGWASRRLPDGRLAVLVTEAPHPGVAAALATAALTGAFVAATSGSRPIELGDLVESLRASADGVVRAGAPLFAFIAIVDQADGRVAWACAGHPGGAVVALGAERDRAAVVALGGGRPDPRASLIEAIRGTTEIPADRALVIASASVRGGDEVSWERRLRAAAADPRKLAAAITETAPRSSASIEDRLAVAVIRATDLADPDG